MIIHFEVDPRTCSYQFLYEIAYWEKNPCNISEIYNTILNYALRPNDCDNPPIAQEPDGVLEAIAKNQNTTHDILMELAQKDDEYIRSVVAEYARFDDIIDLLLNDKETLVLTDALKNKNLKRKHFKKIFNRLINHEIDFNLPNNYAHITVNQFAKKLSEHKLATMTDIIVLGKWLAKNS